MINLVKGSVCYNKFSWMAVGSFVQLIMAGEVVVPSKKHLVKTGCFLY